MTATTASLLRRYATILAESTFSDLAALRQAVFDADAAYAKAVKSDGTGGIDEALILLDAEEALEKALATIKAMRRAKRLATGPRKV